MAFSLLQKSETERVGIFRWGGDDGEHDDGDDEDADMMMLIQ